MSATFRAGRAEERAGSSPAANNSRRALTSLHAQLSHAFVFTKGRPPILHSVSLSNLVNSHFLDATCIFGRRLSFFWPT
jgi:hypothetical protein